MSSEDENDALIPSPTTALARGGGDSLATRGLNDLIEVESADYWRERGDQARKVKDYDEAIRCYRMATEKIYGEAEPKKIRVLIVDDHEVLARLTAEILTMLGFETKFAYSGEEAVALARSWRPYMMLCDVLMPGINGFEAAFLIREFLPDCRILHHSGVVDIVTGKFLNNGRYRGQEVVLYEVGGDWMPYVVACLRREESIR